ncbi:MAG: hypothetical protein OWQ59_12865 [Alicyclobacillaceae bacterium]|jgi:hypothetical protein|uniref:hypothetical protein n=1 Tax=Alicyclobacillus sp. SP_1 TaxID=2942475 RepID=UPI0021571CBE|nr:hypothetical protein [Alicyclobacillus sp. SP_1]MCY0889324.1 hypothetical protein [Alicyclobacillaceae bacterium]MCY0894673.1 hypothetical protein [Alicyclobacillaceae bacterium]
MRLGVNIEYGGKSYDVLELPPEAFVHLIPGMSNEQFRRLDKTFFEYWPEPTVRRNHILSFASEIVGASMDRLFLNTDAMRFTDHEMTDYVERHLKQGNRPS